MYRYDGVGSAAVGTDKTVMTMISSTTRRPELVELLLGCGATPADLTTIFHFERFTAAGTEGSGFTPHACDPAAPAASADYGVAHSVEPTYTASAILMKLPVNQRQTIRWAAMRSGAGFIAPATAANGVGLQSQSSGGTAVHDATFYHEE